jgi:nicotianamine synthase
MTERPKSIETNSKRPSLRQIYNSLNTWPNDHTPSTALDNKMRQLLSSVMDPHMSHNLSETEIVNLRRINASIEYQAEKKTALTMLSLPNPMAPLDDFVYNDYQRLVDLEKNVIDTHTDTDPHKPWLFIGGGPLPLSAILLAKNHGIKSKVIDSSREASEISSQLITKLEEKETIERGHVTIFHGYAETITDYKNHETIFLAALAGDTLESKQTIFRQIKQHAPQNAHVLARSSHGNRQLLYLPVPESTYKDFDLVHELHPGNDVFNSMILLKNSKKD